MMLYWVLRCEELPKQSWVISNCIKNTSENSIHRRHPFVFRSNDLQLPTTPSSTPVDKKTHRGARHLHQSTNPKSLPPSRPGSVPLHSMKKFYRRCIAKHSENLVVGVFVLEIFLPIHGKFATGTIIVISTKGYAHLSVGWFTNQPVAILAHG